MSRHFASFKYWCASFAAVIALTLVASAPAQAAVNFELYVKGANNDILRFDAETGDALPAPGQTGATFLVNNAATYMAISHDGTELLHLLHSSRRIRRFDVTTGLQIGTDKTFSSGETGSNVRGISGDANGFIYVGARGAGTVGAARIDPSDNSHVIFADGDINHYEDPTGNRGAATAVGADGRIYIFDDNWKHPDVDEDDNPIMVSRGTVAIWEDPSTFVGAFAWHSGTSLSQDAKLGPDGNIYFTTRTGDFGLVKFDVNTFEFETIATIAQLGGDPRGMAIGPNGDFFVYTKSGDELIADKVVRVDALTGVVTTFLDGSNGLGNHTDSGLAIRVIPEPASALLLAAAGGAIMLVRRRRTQG